MKPGKQTLDLPATPVAAQYAAILRGFPAARGVVRSHQLHAEALADLRVQPVAVVSGVKAKRPATAGKLCAAAVQSWLCPQEAKKIFRG